VATRLNMDVAEDSFEEQLVTLIGRQPRRMFLALFLSLVVTAGLASRTSSLVAVLTWLTLATAILVLRVFLQGSTLFAKFSPRARLRLTVLLVAMSGIAHGSSLVFFPAMSPFEQAVLSMMLIGLAAGSVATAVGYQPIFLAYMLPTLGPLAILWAATPNLREVGWVNGLMPTLIVLFALVFHALAKDTFRVLRTSYQIRLERAALNRELAAALETAEAANRAKTRFLASASHDLRQPMQTLSFFTGALSLRPLDERTRKMVTHINEALTDLTTELDALLDVSKLDAGIVQPRIEVFDLADLVERGAGLFKTAAEQKKLELRVECPPGVWVNTDRKLLERIVRNLVENAIKYTEVGSVRIQVSRESPSEWRLAVIDTGCGIPEEERARIFEEFYQIGNPERDRRRGLGLGLAIVKRLVELLKLRLSVTSAPGHGTQFELMLPTGEPKLPTCGPVADVPVDPQAFKVLVVDDEEALRNALKALLMEAGATVELASSTEEAMAVLRRTTVDVVIADFRLRGEDTGLRTIKTLRCALPDLPALLLTGETAPERIRQASEAGITVIHKPVTSSVLLKEIARVTQAQDNDDDAKLSEGTLRGQEAGLS
jgi:signal transduction histidine kinase/CheY-like chemotaxis protein